MIRTQIQLSERQLAALKALAAKRKTSVAELIRQGVDAVLSSSGEVDREERKRRAMALAGQFHSDVTDLGTDHDRYLAEAYRS